MAYRERERGGSVVDGIDGSEGVPNGILRR